MRHSLIHLASAAALLSACAPVRSTAPGPTPVPETRTFHSATGRAVDLASLADAAARTDIVFFGEQHGDPGTHRAELALLAATSARRPNIVVSLEFFERDVQRTLDAYLAGQISESAFVATSRPTRRYSYDYRPLVELARANGWPVVASNVPRRLAAAVSRVGLAALDTLSPSDRATAARDISCPTDRYYERFVESMTSHNDSGPPAPADSSANVARNNRYYEAQCVKDETMAESIVEAWRKAGPGALVIHYNGSFHSDMGQGTAARVRRRLPDARSLIVTAIPVADVSRASPASHTDKADYIVFTPQPPKAPAPPAPAMARPSGPVLAIFAHPDDERVIGPLLSRLARDGRETHLVVATDGSKGVQEHAGIPAGAPLAAARAIEAQCAATRLGVRQLHLLGLEDGGLASFAALGRLRTGIAEIIGRVNPAAIITFGGEGGTGHPDHRLVGNVVTQVVQGDSLYRSIDLYYAQLPIERIRTAPRSAPGVNGVAEALLTVRVPFEGADLVAGRESFACHRSQYTPEEMDALNTTLAHVWNGVAYLRPWNGVARDPAGFLRR